jgi:hypothetical protein
MHLGGSYQVRGDGGCANSADKSKQAANVSKIGMAKDTMVHIL